VRPPPSPPGAASSPLASSRSLSLSSSSYDVVVLWMQRWGGKVAVVGKQGGREARGRWWGGEGAAARW
jgi:hypothetical protein